MKTLLSKLTIRKHGLHAKVLILLFSLGMGSPSYGQDQEIKEILDRFTTDYKLDPMFKTDQSFGIEIDKKMWSVEAIASTENSESRITVKKGAPSEPTFYYVTNIRTLKELDQGKLNALTAGAKAFSTDYAPLDIEAMEGFVPNEDFVGDVLSFTFHFWTKGMPEIVPFGQHHTRGTHGAQAAIFYYDTGLRTGYGFLHPGQHANEHPKSKTNPFSSMFILIKGEVTARLNGEDYTIKAGNAFFVPPGMTHELLNPNDEPAEFILLMFGDGA